MIDPSRLPSAHATALGGIQRANQRMVRAAADVAHAGLVQNQAAKVSISSEGRDLAQGPSTAAPGRPPHDLAEALLDSEVAKHELAANVKVLSTRSEMDRTLLDIKPR